MRRCRTSHLHAVWSAPLPHRCTRIRYWADPEIFNASAKFDYDQLIDRVRQTSFLVPGLTITVVDEHIDETGDAAVDELVETDAAQAQADQAESIDDGQRAHDESQLARLLERGVRRGVCRVGVGVDTRMALMEGHVVRVAVAVHLHVET